MKNINSRLKSTQKILPIKRKSVKNDEKILKELRGGLYYYKDPTEPV